MTSRLLTCLAILTMASSLSPDLAAQPATATSPAVTLRLALKKKIVTVAVDRSIQQVVLEQKAGEGWKPLSVAYPPTTTMSVLPGSTRIVTFKLATDIPASNLRAQGYRNAKFPARFQRGMRTFDRKDLTSGQGLVQSSVNSGNVMASTAVTDTKGGTTAAKVVESDIWQIVGDQVYFFNQYRGLQILDLSDPTQPVRTGSLRLPASGEQMFLLDEAGTQVALLGRSNDKARQGAATIWLIRVTGGVPAIVGEVPLEGAITDSRLIGTTLHVLCSVWSPGANNQNWSSEAVLTSIDLADLSVATKLGTLRFPAYSAVLQAAGGHLLIGTQNYLSNYATQQRALHLIDITAAPALVKTFTPRGQIQDKFKISIVGDAVVAVSLDWRNWNDRQSWVETFPIAGSTITPLAALELEGARGESLYATRFDGDRLYVVTFLQIDPLFIVDLADPAAPVLSGVLEVPGWSTYLEPLGDQLLAVGVESGRVTVSLFDVADVTAPTLLSRLALGPEGGHSWSEANYDEKAVEYLPDQGVVMVPFQTWDWNSGGQQKAIQVVNVGADTLTAGATIEHNFNPRRGSFIAGHFVTISGQELLVHSTDPTASGAPVIQLPLAWRTDRVIPVGGHLVQIEDGNSGLWNGGMIFRLSPIATTSGNAKLRITSAADPDALEQIIDLGSGQIVGQTQKDDQLFLAQWIPAADKQPQSLRTLALDLGSTSPVITESGRVEHDITGLNSWELKLDSVKPLWVGDQKLVWHLPVNQNYYWWWGPIFTVLPVFNIAPTKIAVTNAAVVSPPPSVAAASSPIVVVPPTVSLGSPAAVLCPVSLDAAGLIADTPQVVRVNGTVRGTSTAFTQSGFIFLSYDTAVQEVLPKPQKSLLASTSIAILPYFPYPYTTRLASWLQVIDWRTNSPVLRDPVSIPGQLLSIAQADAQGAVILTNSDQQISTNGPATRVIQASGYDGVSAWQLDSYITATPFYSATATDGVRLYLAREAGTVGVVGIGYNTTTGRLAQINSWTTTETPALLNVAGGHLLASSYGNLEVASIHLSTGALTAVASYDTPTNLWLRVDRAAFTPTLDLWIPAADYGVELLQRAALAP
jgi:hypothetical protein